MAAALPPSCSAFACRSLSTSPLAIVRKELICASDSWSLDFNSPLNSSSANSASNTGKVTATVFVSVLGEGEGEGKVDVGDATVVTELEFPDGWVAQPLAISAETTSKPNLNECQNCFIFLVPSHYLRILCSHQKSDFSLFRSKTRSRVSPGCGASNHVSYNICAKYSNEQRTL